MLCSYCLCPLIYNREPWCLPLFLSDTPLSVPTMLEGYITPVLMSYIDKYVKNIKPSDLKLSFWGGDAVLRNLELRVDVLEQELHLPLEVKSGKIRELTLQFPWNAILSKSVEVTLKDVEIVVKLKDVRLSASQSQSQSAKPDSDAPTPVASAPQPSEMAPGYLQGYMSRIFNNGILHVRNMVVKVIEEECDMLMTWNFGSMEGYTVDENWQRSYVYTDYLQGEYAVNKVMEVSDLVINLHPIENGGQSSSPREPFVHRCSFVGRQREEYRGKSLVKWSINLLFEDVEMSVDENQFCLFYHHLNWLLGMYYSKKPLHGRDDHLHSTLLSERRHSTSSTSDSSFVDVPQPSSSTAEEQEERKEGGGEEEEEEEEEKEEEKEEE